MQCYTCDFGYIWFLLRKNSVVKIVFVSELGVGFGFVWSLFVKACNKIAMRVTGHSAG